LESTISLLNKAHPLSSGSYTSSDAELFKHICIAVSTRSASLVAASTIALLRVNNELCKYPLPTGKRWNCESTSSGTPSPSDSGLGSMDEEIRWSRRGSIFSVQGSRRGSLASPNLLSVQPKQTVGEGIIMDLHREDGNRGAILGENGVVMEEPTDMDLDDDIDDDDDDDDDVVVAFCGSVMEKYHTFRSRCQDILDELVKQPCPDKQQEGVNGDGSEGNVLKVRSVVEQRRVVLEENGDGGILGAGILAAVVDSKDL